MNKEEYDEKKNEYDKKIVKLNPKFFTECVDDVEYVVPICNDVNKVIEKAIEKMIKEDIKNKKINKSLQN